MTTLEKIRAEIYEQAEQMHFINGEFYIKVDKALQILDKYASEECEHDCEHCAYLECPKEPCDLIRRTDMLDAVGHGTTYTTEHLQKIINGLPSVQPKAKTGRWISREGGGQVLPFWGKYQCSECGECAENSNFCPNCGAKMVEPYERSE